MTFQNAPSLHTRLLHRVPPLRIILNLKQPFNLLLQIRHNPSAIASRHFTQSFQHDHLFALAVPECKVDERSGHAYAEDHEHHENYDKGVAGFGGGDEGVEGGGAEGVEGVAGLVEI